MEHPFSHVLVPIDLNGDAGAVLHTARQLAAGSGALVTLLYVHGQPAKIEPADPLDALTCLHQVMKVPQPNKVYIPSASDDDRSKSARKLRELKQEFTKEFSEKIELCIVWRQGDPLHETLSYISETGVDVVVTLDPAVIASPAMRRLSKSLRECCPCQVQIVRPPREGALVSASPTRRWWRPLVQGWGQAWRRLVHPAKRHPSVDEVHSENQIRAST